MPEPGWVFYVYDISNSQTILHFSKGCFQSYTYTHVNLRACARARARALCLEELTSSNPRQLKINFILSGRDVLGEKKDI